MGRRERVPLIFIPFPPWCHQRGYICFLEEFGGRPVQPGGSCSAAFIVGYFDSIEEMERVGGRERRWAPELIKTYDRFLESIR